MTTIIDAKNVTITIDGVTIDLPASGEVVSAENPARHWYVDADWVQTGTHDGYPTMAMVFTIRGPAPFDHSTVRSEDQAHAITAELNRVYGRRVPRKAEAEPERCEVADSIGEVMRDQGLLVRVRGDTITLSGE